MRKSFWIFGLAVALTAFVPAFAQQDSGNGAPSQLPPEQSQGQAPLIMGYDAAPGTGQDIDNAYPSNSQLGYKGVVFGNFNQADAADEIVVDFGAIGLWYYDNGNWTQISGLNPDSVVGGVTFTTTDEEIVADFGATGLWYWNGEGTWFQMSGLNATGMFFVDDDDDGTDDLHVDFGATGLWRFDFSGSFSLSNWTQLSGVNPDKGLMVDFWVAGFPEAVWTFGSLGLWNIYMTSGVPYYTQLTGTATYEDDFASGNFTAATGAKDLVADFASLGLWLYKGASPNAWYQISSMSANRIKEVKFVGGSQDDELLAEDNLGGLYWGNWNGSTFVWTLITNDDIGPGSAWCETFDRDGTDSGDQEVMVPLTTGGAKIFDYSAGSTYTTLISTAGFVKFMVKGDYFGKGRDSTLAFVCTDAGSFPGLWLYEMNDYPGSLRISTYIPDGGY